MAKILVTSGNTRVAYAICCTLAQNGHEVYIGDRNLFTMAGMSRYCKGRMTYPSPFTEQDAFIETIKGFVKEKHIDVLLPVLEETFTCLKHKEALKESGVSFLFPNFSDALKLHAKSSLTSLAKELGIETPPTWELTEVFSSEELCKNLPFPVIVKPKQGGGGWGMKKFTDHNELYEIVSNEIDNPQNYIVQAVIVGDLIGVSAIYHQGKIIASDSYKFTNAYPLHVGQSTTRVTQFYPKALEASKTMLDYLKWNGVCEIDFIFDEKNDKNYLIDANPRFWGSVKHNIVAGVDYPLYYTLLAQDNTDFEIGEARPQTRTRWLGGDILRIIGECRISSNKLQYLKNTLFGPIRYCAHDDWNIKDPLPFFTWGINLIMNKILHRKKDTLPGVWE